MRSQKIDIRNLFIEVYKAYPAKTVHKDGIENSNNIILPPSALNELSHMNDFNNSNAPILFRILNIELNIFTHCGVAEFTAEEGTCYLPTTMFDRLCLMEGQKVSIRNTALKLGTFIKLQPHLTEFTENPEHNILEYNLRNYFCVTEGDTISVKHGGKTYKLDVIECKPEKAIRTLNTNIEIDFCPSKDYKVPSKDV